MQFAITVFHGVNPFSATNATDKLFRRDWRILARGTMTTPFDDPPDRRSVRSELATVGASIFGRPSVMAESDAI
jgi:hypothetical protein